MWLHRNFAFTTSSRFMKALQDFLSHIWILNTNNFTYISAKKHSFIFQVSNSEQPSNHTLLNKHIDVDWLKPVDIDMCMLTEVCKSTDIYIYANRDLRVSIKSRVDPTGSACVNPFYFLSITCFELSEWIFALKQKVVCMFEHLCIPGKECARLNLHTTFCFNFH